MRKACLGALIVLAAAGLATVSEAAPDTLTFEDRVRAQEAIERVYYSHQIGASEPFESVVTRAVLEEKVRAYLEQFSKTRITDQAVERETERITNQTQMPERLREIYAALGNDALLIKECLVRPTLVTRLARNFVVSSRSALDEGTPLPLLRRSAGAADPTFPNTSQCAADDTWDGGVLDDVVPRSGHTAVWTGSLMLMRGGGGYDTGPLRSGGRYDPATDVWTPMSTVGAPSSGRAVWAGTVMLVWAGGSGARYDPLMDDWTPMSDVGAPSGNTMVWTGAHLLVWGGGTAGKYDPESDSWTPMSATGAPSSGAAVWTGNQALAWDALNSTGARYDPSSDSWSPISSVNAPAARVGHTTVWTGGSMLVWGGSGQFGYPVLATGGRYDPNTDTWSATSTSMPGRMLHTAVWTGKEMIVWGGRSGTTSYSEVGGRYDPVSDTWATTSTVNTPGPRNSHTAVWTGSLMLVWGGEWWATSTPSILGNGGRYDPATDSWTPMSTLGASARRGYAAVWTGAQLIIWGGTSPYAEVISDGAIYDPALDSWTVISATGGPTPTGRATVWTGTEMIVWGGLDGGGQPFGARYRPVTNSWSPMSGVGGPPADRAVWTGGVMVAWGGGSGARYNPASDSWLPISATGASFAGTAIWTGDQVVFWNGGGGAKYDPVTDNWSPISSNGAPELTEGHTAVWSGNSMLVWGGYLDGNGYVNSGGRYDPESDTWMPFTTIGAPSGRVWHSAIWTGEELVVWGGARDGGFTRYNDGGRYNPITDNWRPTSSVGAPSPRYQHRAFWTGTSMLIWGGEVRQTILSGGGRYFIDAHTDDDGDGFTICGGDCNDSSNSINPAAVEVCNGVDDNCSGQTDEDAFGTDSDSDGVHNTCDNCRVAYNPDQLDSEGDGIGNSCDNCVTIVNPVQQDLDADLRGDACDNCPAAYNPFQGDTDADRRGDACDNCLFDYNTSQSDFDHDHQGDSCDLDDGLIYVYSTDKSYREWQAESGYSAWNSYRGSLSVLRATGEYTQVPGSNVLAVRDCSLGDPFVFDGGTPNAGEVAFVLVTGVSAGIESGLGTNSAGLARVNSNPCP